MDYKECIEKCLKQGMSEEAAGTLADSLGIKEASAPAATAAIDLDALGARVASLIKLPENLSSQISEAVEKAIKDRGLDQVARKIVPSMAEKTPDELKAELRDAFIMGVLKSGMPNSQLTDAQTKALSEGTTTAGGYLVPTEYRAELIKRMPELSELFPFVRKVPVITDAGEIPSLATDVSITWGRAENAAVSESDAVFGQVTWSVMNMSAISYLSRELVSDANPGIVQLVTDLFAEAVAAERDKKIAMGTNSSQPDGIFSASGVTAITGVSGALTYPKLVSLKHGLKKKYRRGARWIMSDTTRGWIEKIEDSQNRPILVDALIKAEEPRIMGLPYSIQDDIDDGVIAIGDLKYYYWFDRQKMEIETTTTGGDTFSKHQLAIKVVERCDGCVALAEAFKKSGALTVPT